MLNKSIKINPNLHTRVKVQATLEGKEIQEWVEEKLEEGLKKKEV